VTAEDVPRQAGMLAAQRRNPAVASLDRWCLGAVSGYSSGPIMHERWTWQSAVTTTTSSCGEAPARV